VSLSGAGERRGRQRGPGFDRFGDDYRCRLRR
jgi:hypothetical protein